MTWPAFSVAHHHFFTMCLTYQSLLSCHWCLLWELFVAFFLPNAFHVDTQKGRKVCSPCFRHVGRRGAPRAELLPNITKYKCESKFLRVQWSWWKCVLIICWTVLFSECELSPIFPEHLVVVFFFFWYILKDCSRDNTLKWVMQMSPVSNKFLQRWRLKMTWK